MPDRETLNYKLNLLERFMVDIRPIAVGIYGESQPLYFHPEQAKAVLEAVRLGHANLMATALRSGKL